MNLLKIFQLLTLSGCIVATTSLNASDVIQANMSPMGVGESRVKVLIRYMQEQNVSSEGLVVRTEITNSGKDSIRLLDDKASCKIKVFSIEGWPLSEDVGSVPRILINDPSAKKMASAPFVELKSEESVEWVIQKNEIYDQPLRLVDGKLKATPGATLGRIYPGQYKVMVFCSLYSQPNEASEKNTVIGFKSEYLEINYVK